ncbi:MAG: pyrimidine reductase family protein [Rhodococcus sp.]|nr:pyrimidine reductase family protein [Rhodococcus sp. (in: high G+C Gram-positive bacteria)]
MISHVRRVDNGTYFTSNASGELVEPALTDDDLRELYGYPPTSGRPWVRANFVSSIDGAASVDGKSGGLGSEADRRVFRILRELADAVVVGAGTARAENYGGVSLDAEARARRQERGAPHTPPVVVISGRADLDAHSRLFAETAVPTIVIAGANADKERLSALESAGADVVRTDTSHVTTTVLLETLAGRGLHHILCEGGPGLFGRLCADDGIDELCSTVSPVLVGGQAPRISTSPSPHLVPMTREHILAEDDGTLLFRWVRSRPA